VEIFQKKLEFSREMTPDYYEPGLMENLEQYKGVYDEQSKQITIRCEVKGLRYDNRTSNLERVSVGDAVQIVRDEGNAFNSNNFSVNSKDGASLGHLPAELCNALGPLYDAGCASIISSVITYIEKIGQRSRYAKQGILFVELIIKLRGI
jgi:hypothetical protein